MQTNDLLRKLRTADEVEKTMNPSSKLYGQAADHINALLNEIAHLEGEASYWRYMAEED